MSRDISVCCTILQTLVPEIISNWKLVHEDSELRVIQTVRTAEEQQALYAQGRTTPGDVVTRADGVNKLSRHQVQTLHGELACHAVDFGIFMEDGTYLKNSKPYGEMAVLVSQSGLQSGRPWCDYDHAQCIVV